VNLFIELMLFPFLACLVLTGMHVYLGVHVIARKVIFVDLALATIAALGALWGALLGWDVHQDIWVIKGFSLGFTFVGAALFALTRGRKERVPHEAIIGITYAVALAAMILGSAKLPHGAEEVRDLQAGSILWVSGATVASTAGLYALIGLFHYRFRRQFFALSMDHDKALAEGLNVKFWDFLFYVSFGFVVTSSVAIAGILLVFSYLVIPAVIGVLFAHKTSSRLLVGWAVGASVSALGVSLSYYADLPSGPLIVVSLGCALILAGVLRYILDQPSKLMACGKILLGAGLLGGLLFGSSRFRKTEDHDLSHLLAAGNPAERMLALHELKTRPGDWAGAQPVLQDLAKGASLEVKLALLDAIKVAQQPEGLAIAKGLLSDPDDILREEALAVVVALDLKGSVPELLAAAEVEPDEFLRIELAEALLEAGEMRGVPILLEILDSGEAEMARQDACEHLHAHIPLTSTYHADSSYAGHAEEMAEYRAWWEQHGGG